MDVFLLTLFVFAFALVGLGIGVLMGRPPVKGTCGTASCIKSASCAGCSHSHQHEGLDP